MVVFQQKYQTAVTSTLLHSSYVTLSMVRTKVGWSAGQLDVRTVGQTATAMDRSIEKTINGVDGTNIKWFVRGFLRIDSSGTKG